MTQYKGLDDVSGLLSSFAHLVCQSDFCDFQGFKLCGLDFGEWSKSDREFHSDIAVFFDFKLFLFDGLAVFEGELVVDVGKGVGSLWSFFDEPGEFAVISGAVSSAEDFLFLQSFECCIGHDIVDSRRGDNLINDKIPRVNDSMIGKNGHVNFS